jgi:hypothetical protein
MQGFRKVMQKFWIRGQPSNDHEFEAVKATMDTPEYPFQTLPDLLADGP